MHKKIYETEFGQWLLPQDKWSIHLISSNALKMAFFLPTSMAVSMKLFCLEANSASSFCCLSLALWRLKKKVKFCLINFPLIPNEYHLCVYDYVQLLTDSQMCTKVTWEQVSPLSRALFTWSPTACAENYSMEKGKLPHTQVVSDFNKAVL